MVALSSRSHRVTPKHPLGVCQNRNCCVKNSGGSTRATSMSAQGRIKLSFKSPTATCLNSPCCAASAFPEAGTVSSPPSTEAGPPQHLGISGDGSSSPATGAPPKLKFFFSHSPTIKPLSRDGSPVAAPLSRDGSSSDVSSPRLKSCTPRKGSYDIDDFVMPLGWGSPRVQTEEEVKPKEISIPHARRPAWLPCIPQASVGGKRYRGSSVHQDLLVPRPDESSGEEDVSDEAFIERHRRLEYLEHNHRLTVASQKKKKEEESELADSPSKTSLLSCSFNSGTRCSSPSASESGTPRSTRRAASFSSAR